ncbi:hypothetical protein GJAV_G00084720 [Gymnothorax javanicus]|nr:hypothetical protein GJAV_G00084720 [Gymnothorax javanicus]
MCSSLVSKRTEHQEGWLLPGDGSNATFDEVWSSRRRRRSSMAAVVLRRARRLALQISALGMVPGGSHGGFEGVRQKSTVQYAVRPDLPKLAYQKVNGKSPGVVFLPGLASNMTGRKAEALEELCKSLGHAYLRFDYTGCGASEGVWADCTVGSWKRDVLYVLDELVEGPQILVGSSLGGWLMLLAAIARPEKTAALVGIATAADHVVTVFKSLPAEVQMEAEEKGEWVLPSKYSEDGGYSLSLDFVREAESHCILLGPIPVSCPVRLIHGLKDPDVPWHVSMQVAERVLGSDVDVILRKGGQHRMSEKEDMKLMVYTVDDLIDKLTTAA